MSAKPSQAYTITAVSKQGIVESITIEESPPSFLHCFDKQWSSLFINPVDAKPMPFGIDSYEPHAPKSIAMAMQDVVECSNSICTATGISFKIFLPEIPLAAKLEFTSPLANATNCLRIIKALTLKGKALHDSLSPEYLAGIFICLVKDKGLAKIRDAAATNAYLRSADTRTLSNAISFLVNINTTIGLPSISLHEVALAQANHWRDATLSDNKGKANATLTLLHWLDAVSKARSDRAQKSYDEKHKESTALKAKIFTSPVKQQEKNNSALKAEMRKLLKALTLQHAISANAAFLADLAFTVRMAEFTEPEKLQTVALELEKRFNLDTNAISLASCLRNIKVNKILEDMQTLTEAPTVEKGFDLLSIVARKLNK